MITEHRIGFRAHAASLGLKLSREGSLRIQRKCQHTTPAPSANGAAVPRNSKVSSISPETY
jgi:hypothetical protein